MTAMPLPTSSHKRGDVVVVLFPNSDLRMAKLRPALVVQANSLNTGLAQTVIAMITSKMFRAGHPCRVTILLNSNEGQQPGLLTDSARQGWKEAQSRQTRPTAELWDGIEMCRRNP